MSLVFNTRYPATLLGIYTSEIDEGHVDTWIRNKDGNFTHKPPQWINAAWLCPVIEPDRLVFNIVNTPGRPITKYVYAVYHGRFMESMLAHCDLWFDDAYATGLAQYPDLIAA